MARLPSVRHGCFLYWGYMPRNLPHRIILWYVYVSHTGTRLFRGFCALPIPISDSTVRSVRNAYPYLGRGHRLVQIRGCAQGFLYNPHTVPDRLCKFCKTSIVIPCSSDNSVRNLIPYRIYPRTLFSTAVGISFSSAVLRGSEAEKIERNCAQTS